MYRDRMLGDATGSSDSDLLAQLHTVAVAIYDTTTAAHAMATVQCLGQSDCEEAVLAQYAPILQGLHDQFAAIVAQFQDASPAQQSLWSAYLDDLGQSIQQMLNLPADAAVGVLQHAIDAAQSVASSAEGAVGSLVSPIVLALGAVAVAVLLFTRSAERTRTYRKFVA